MRRLRAGVGLVCLAWLVGAAGCAQRQVVASDRAVLWRAALQAAREEGFEVIAADETKGHVLAEKRTLSGTETAERLRMTITCRRVGEAYHARVVVRRAAPERAVPEVDRTKRYAGVYVGGTGRTTRDYGATPTRASNIEAAVLRRIRRLVR